MGRGECRTCGPFRRTSEGPTRRRLSRAARSRARHGRRLDELAVEELDDAVGDVEHHRVVGRDDRGHALGPDDGPDEQHDPLAGLRVELAGRLVREQEPRPVGQRPRDRDPLLLAARQLVRPVARPLGEPDELQQLGDPARRARAGPRRRAGAAPRRSRRRTGSGSARTSGRRTRSSRRRTSTELVLAHRRDLRPVDDDACPPSARSRPPSRLSSVVLPRARPAADREQLARGRRRGRCRGAHGRPSRRSA